MSNRQILYVFFNKSVNVSFWNQIIHNEGIVTRKVCAEAPIRIEYRLIGKGCEWQSMIGKMDHSGTGLNRFGEGSSKKCILWLVFPCH
ncbi:winged helix-turn-helix transcriptional regulator [Domibacillus aminovorans]|uniref:HTH hxlR-type domain-containing protein n=1 Tax=Domibacillus aminovorans TaxID=29332 RepID=A0A177L8L9_9BACI|nr:hypothetical protein AWH49_11885 [Domibacillus aminovorans]